MKPCEDCSLCCQGHLVASVYGRNFGLGTTCPFLKECCTIYSYRAPVCRNYQCAYTQGLFTTDDMRPDISGVIVSVEFDANGKQFLKVMETVDKVEQWVYNEIEKFCSPEVGNTYYIKVKKSY